MAEMLINNRHRHGEKSPNLKGFVSYLDLSQEYPLELALREASGPAGQQPLDEDSDVICTILAPFLWLMMKMLLNCGF